MPEPKIVSCATPEPNPSHGANGKNGVDMGASALHFRQAQIHQHIEHVRQKPQVHFEEIKDDLDQQLCRLFLFLMSNMMFTSTQQGSIDSQHKSIALFVYFNQSPPPPKKYSITELFISISTEGFGLICSIRFRNLNLRKCRAIAFLLISSMAHMGMATPCIQDIKLTPTSEQ